MNAAFAWIAREERGWVARGSVRLARMRRAWIGLLLMSGVIFRGPALETSAWASGESARQAAATPYVVAEKNADGDGLTGVDILSDTRGVDFKPYVKRILRQVYQTWIPLIPPDSRPPKNAPGSTAIRFAIDPAGKLISMHLDDSSHNDGLNRAAWGSITGVGQFPPLPKEFSGPNLEIRVRYYVNMEPPRATAAARK